MNELSAARLDGSDFMQRHSAGSAECVSPALIRTSPARQLHAANHGRTSRHCACAQPRAAGAARVTRAGAAIAAAVLGMGIGLGPNVPAMAQFIQYATSRNYLAASESVRNGYVAGLLDSLYVQGLMPRPVHDCTATMRLGQIRELFDTWLRNHPSVASDPLPSTFPRALEAACQ